MKLIEVNEISTILIKQLFEIWDKSVREIHLFLSDSDIKNISKYIPQALNSIAHLIEICICMGKVSRGTCDKYLKQKLI